MSWNSTFTKPAKPLQRKTPLRATKPMGRTSFEPADKEAALWLNGMKSRGMKGRAATASQKRFHDLLADVVGCVACRKEGGFTDYVSIHHIDGRTKPNAHWLVLPLCGPHHQDMGVNGVIPVHPHKTRFEAAYGKQMDLLCEAIQILIDGGFDVPADAFAASGLKKDNPTSAATDSGVAHNA